MVDLAPVRNAQNWGQDRTRALSMPGHPAEAVSLAPPLRASTLLRILRTTGLTPSTLGTVPLAIGGTPSLTTKLSPQVMKAVRTELLPGGAVTNVIREDDIRAHVARAVAHRLTHSTISSGH